MRKRPTRSVERTGGSRCALLTILSRWRDVVRIEATGTDAFGAFEIWLTFHHSDGSEVVLTVQHRGYDKILESLPERFPSIVPDWYDRMAEQPWHVESVLYSR